MMPVAKAKPRFPSELPPAAAAPEQPPPPPAEDGVATAAAVPLGSAIATQGAAARPALPPFSWIDLLSYDLISNACEAPAYGLGLWTALELGAHLHLRLQRPALLVLGVLAGATIGLVVFLLVLIVLRRTLCRRIPSGRFLRTSPRLYPWSFAIALHMIFHRSPVSNLVHSNLLLRLLYYRGMGLRLPWSSYLAQNVKIVDPWLTTIGERTLLGEGAVISCHKIDRDVVTIEPVVIGRQVLIGAMAHIQPGVRIDDHAVISANALVMRGSHVRSGECWIGNPAKRLDLAGQLRAFAAVAAP